MIQITRPVAASKKWLRIRGGLIRPPPSRPCCIPPRASQMVRSTKPPPAVSTHAMSAAHFIARRSALPAVSLNGPHGTVRSRLSAKRPEDEAEDHVAEGLLCEGAPAPERRDVALAAPRMLPVGEDCQRVEDDVLGEREADGEPARPDPGPA